MKRILHAAVRTIPLLLLCGLWVDDVRVFPSDRPPSPKKTRIFSSEKGGFQAIIPETWYIKEVVGEGVYQAFLSREEIRSESDRFRVGVSVTRLDDFRPAFKFASTEPRQMALEFANRTASELSKTGRHLVIALPGSMATHEFEQFRISADGGTPDCISAWLQVNVQGTRWFHALWEKPCQDKEISSKKIESMSARLHLTGKTSKK